MKILADEGYKEDYGWNTSVSQSEEKRRKACEAAAKRVVDPVSRFKANCYRYLENTQ